MNKHKKRAKIIKKIFILGTIGLIYATGVFFFSDRFTYGTVINGTKYSFKTPTYVANNISNRTRNYTLKIKGSNTYDEVTSSEFDYGETYIEGSILDLKNNHKPFSVASPTPDPNKSTCLASDKTPFLLFILVISNLSPKTPTYPSSEFLAVITDDKFPILATVWEPYSLLNVPHAEPELSLKHIVLPFNLGILLSEISMHSSNVSKTSDLKLTLDFSTALYALLYLNENCLEVKTPDFK